jgi:hypothetical protein
VSSAATAAFLAAWRRLTAARTALCKIDLTTPSAKTLRFATTGCDTPDGFTWQEGLICDPIRESISMFGPGVTPSDASIWIANRKEASQAAGQTMEDLLSDFLFQNATVTLYLWIREREFGIAPTLGASDLFQVFKGRVSRPAEIGPDGFRLFMLQDMSWNKQVPPTVVDKVSYPDSPDGSLGLPIPIIYGAHLAQGMRSPWTSAFTNKSKQEDSGAGRGVVPLILVDAGIGASSVKVVAASHLCTKILDRANGMSPFMVGESLLNPIDTSGSVTETLGASESYLSIADENVVALAAAIPIDTRASESNALNPKRAMDPFDETSFATLDQNTTHGILQLILPNLGNLGRIESVQYYVAWSGDAGNGNNLRIQSRNPGVGFGTTTANWAATATTPAVQVGTWNAADWTQNWDFGSGGTAHPWDLRLDFTGGTTNKAKIYWAVLVVKYRPSRSLVTPSGRTVLSYTVDRRKLPGPLSNPFARPLWGPTYFDVPAQFRLEGQFYGNVKGYADDGSGTYTGSAGSLIERAPDVLRHFLVTYAGVSGGSIETGAGATGSFVDLRDSLRNAQPTDFKLAVHIGERMTAQQALQKIAEQAGVALYLDRFTDKWLAFPWKLGAAFSYDYAVPWDFMSDFRGDESSSVDVRHAIRVKYGFDHFKGTTLYEAFLNAAASGQGLTQPTIRDQRLTIDSSNNKVDWTEGASTLAATLSSNTYTPIDLASELRSKVRAQEGPDNSFFAGYGFDIKTGFNDAFDFLISGVSKTATLRAGKYSAEAAAIELARAMNAVPSLSGRVFSVSYSHSTNKFTVSATGGNFQVDYLGGAPNVATSALPVFGFVASALPGAATSFTSNVVRYGDRFWYGDGDVGDTNIYKWNTGANAATNCADVLGILRTADVTVTIGIAHGDFIRGDRERDSNTFQGYYDPKEEMQITAEWIRDELSAVMLRNRRFDLMSTPRAGCRFASDFMPDVRRMDIVPIDASVDAMSRFPKYGSDGSWVGKSVLVLEVVQNLGPSDWTTEIMGVHID